MIGRCLSSCVQHESQLLTIEGYLFSSLRYIFVIFKVFMYVVSTCLFPLSFGPVVVKFFLSFWATHLIENGSSCENLLPPIDIKKGFSLVTYIALKKSLVWNNHGKNSLFKRSSRNDFSYVPKLSLTMFVTALFCSSQHQLLVCMVMVKLRACQHMVGMVMEKLRACQHMVSEPYDKFLALHIEMSHSDAPEV